MPPTESHLFNIDVPGPAVAEQLPVAEWMEQETYVIRTTYDVIYQVSPVTGLGVLEALAQHPDMISFTDIMGSRVHARADTVVAVETSTPETRAAYHRWLVIHRDESRQAGNFD